MIEFPQHADNLQRLMGAAQLRHRVLSQNLANLNTPGYKRLDVEFEAMLAESLRSTGPDRPVPQPSVFEEEGLPVRADGNNVDVDREMAQLNKNSLAFQTYSQILSSQLDAMRRAVRRP